MITATVTCASLTFPKRLGGQSHQRGPQMLALPVQRVIRVTDDVRVESLDLLRQPVTDCFQERFNRADDLLPVAAWLGIRRIANWSTNHFGISRKHVREL